MSPDFMCWVLYVAAARPLPLQPFDGRTPEFNVAELTPREHVVRRQFSQPFVYAVGSHTQCGCGFDRSQANPDHPAELPATEASLRRLHRYLAEAMSVAGPVELFACWDGDQGTVPDHRWKRGLSDFHERMDWFPDRTFIELR